MKTNKWLTISILAITAGAVVLFVMAYNFALSTALSDASQTDRQVLSKRNNEIIVRLCDAQNVSQWQEIIDSYTDIIVRVEDTYGKTEYKTTDKNWSLLDVKVTTCFEYHGMQFCVRSSVCFERDYLTDSTYAVRLFIVITSIVLLVLASLCAIIYIIMLRPYKKLYKTIEDFENNKTFERINNNTYTAKVYNRLCDLRDNVIKEQNNQRRIIASISHDIKTPLTSIMGYSEQLKKDNLPKERRERYLDTLYGKAVEIRDLVNDFDEYLSYSLDSGFYTEPYSTDEICKSINDSFFYELDACGVTLTVKNLAPGCYVKIDAQKMRRVSGNIITNSLKHYIDDKKLLKVTFTHNNDRLYFCFSDSGCGVDPDKYDIIFEPLYTSDEGRKVAGLGLAICREIVESHNGKIWAEKSELGGLAICGYLPEYKPTVK